MATFPTREGGRVVGCDGRDSMFAGGVTTAVLPTGAAALLSAACMFGFFMRFAFLSKFCFNPQVEPLQLGSGFPFRLDFMNGLPCGRRVGIAGPLAKMHRAGWQIGIAHSEPLKLVGYSVPLWVHVIEQHESRGVPCNP